MILVTRKQIVANGRASLATKLIFLSGCIPFAALQQALHDATWKQGHGTSSWSRVDARQMKISYNVGKTTAPSVPGNVVPALSPPVLYTLVWGLEQTNKLLIHANLQKKGGKKKKNPSSCRIDASTSVVHKRN